MEGLPLDNSIPPTDERSSVPPVQQPISSIPPRPVQQHPPAMSESLLSASDYVQGRSSGGAGKIIFWLFFLVLLGAGGVVGAGYLGYINLPFLFKPPTLDESIATLSQINSVRFGVDLLAKVEDREPTTKPISLGNETSYLGLINVSPNSELKMNATFDWQRGQQRQQGETKISGSVRSDSMSMEFSSQVRYVDGDVYVYVEKFPEIVPGVSNLKNKWVLISSESGKLEAKKYFQLINKNKPQESTKIVKKSDLDLELLTLLREGVKANAIVLTEPVRGRDPLGNNAWKLTLKLDPQKLEIVRKDVSARLAEFFPGLNKFYIFNPPIEGVNMYPTLKTGTEISETLLAQTVINLYIDNKTKIPTAITFKIPYAFDEKSVPAFAGKQVTINTTVTLNNINQPIVVQAPEGSVPIGEVWGLGSGRSPEEKKAQTQSDDIVGLRRALDYYKQVNGKYPDRLDDLLNLEVPYGTPSLVEKVMAIPPDMFTDQPLIYSSTTDGNYRLVYEMRSMANSTLFSHEDYVDGTNTATADDVSLEGGALSPTLDSDHDGLTDIEEARYGTNPNNSDTDGDSYSDSVEVKSGHDPLVNAKTGQKVTWH